MTAAASFVRLAGTDDHDRIASLFAGAFAATPLAQWLVPEPDRRADYLSTFFDTVVAAALYDSHAVMHTTADGSAAALWHTQHAPPDTVAPGDPIGDLSLLADLGVADGDTSMPERVSVLQALLIELRPNARHYRLSYLAVDPGRRSQGLGRALLAHQLHHLDIARIASHAVSDTTPALVVLALTGYATQPPVPFGDSTLVWRHYRPPAMSYRTSAGVPLPDGSDDPR